MAHSYYLPKQPGDDTRNTIKAYTPSQEVMNNIERLVGPITREKFEGAGCFITTIRPIPPDVMQQFGIIVSVR